MTKADDQERIGDMTRAELRAFVQNLFVQEFGTHYIPRTSRPVSQTLDSMRRNIITPKPGEPSAVEMILEDRDRWNTG